MTGSWRLYRPGEQWRTSPAATRVVLGVPGVVAVCAASPVVEVLAARDVPRHPVLRRLGPDLCDPTVDLAAVVGRLRARAGATATIGAALLDQQSVSGIGNVYRCDVLFLHGLSPWRPVATLSDEQLLGLLDTAGRLLRDNLERATRTTVPRGRPGSLWVHGRAGRPCRRCGTPVALAQLGSPPRHVYWCPSCQPPDRAG